MNMFVLFTLVSCNSRPTSNDTTDNCADSIEKEIGIEYGDSATIKVLDTMPELKDSDTIPKEYLCTDWIRVYSKYIIDSIDTSRYREFSICYIDNDSVPEIGLHGRCFADGTIVLTQQNGVVSSIRGYMGVHYIEKSGLIYNGCARHGTYAEEIIQLINGSFKILLCTEAIWNGKYESQSGFTYYINDKVIDSLVGNDINEESCTQINNALQQAYHSKGESCLVYSSPQGLFPISSLYAKK